MKEYYLGLEGYRVNDIFNRIMIPKMKNTLKLDNKTIESLVKMFEEIYGYGYNDGYETCNNEINDF